MDEFKWNSDDYQQHMHADEQAAEPVGAADSAVIVKPKKKKEHKKVRLSIMVASIILAMVVSVSGYALLSPAIQNIAQNDKPDISAIEGLNPPAENQNTPNATQTVNTASGEKMEIPDIADKVGPAVVGVINKTTFQGYGPFGYFGQGGNIGEEVQQGSGSGIIISSDGYIITNNHVIEDASSVVVILNTGEEYTATIKGADSKTDLALLKIEASELPYATLGDSSQMRVGDQVVAIGNPLGQELAGTVTVGYISALNRSITIDNKTMTLLQTDAAINPGNSGGALVNLYGEVIGINTAKISSDQYEGLGFAIPTEEAKPIIEDLLSTGYVKGRPVIGIAGRAISSRDAQTYGLVEGVYVYSMTTNSPAYMAGIKVGDIIIECEGTKITTVDELNEIKDQHKPNDVINLKVWRSGETVDISLVLGEEMPG